MTCDDSQPIREHPSLAAAVNVIRGYTELTEAHAALEQLLEVREAAIYLYVHGLPQAFSAGIQ